MSKVAFHIPLLRLKVPLASLLAKRIAVFVMGLSALMASVAVAQQQFLKGFETMPLMEGLTQTEQDLVYFDSPEGSIVQTEANGKVKPATVARFYSTLLPQLGWQRSGNKWQRGEATLELKLRGEGEVTTVIFRRIGK